jgi:hypothetical protein
LNIREAGIILQIGDKIYHPTCDDANAGLFIEEMTITKLLGPNQIPFGRTKIVWSYGNISYWENFHLENKNRPRPFIANRCYISIKDCIEPLEWKRSQLLKLEKERKANVILEIADLTKFLRELKSEAPLLNRISNKKIQILGRLNIEEDLRRKNYLE